MWGLAAWISAFGLVCVKLAMRGLGHVGVRIRLLDFGSLLRNLN